MGSKLKKGKSKNPSQKSALFQFAVAVLIVLIAAFFIYSSFFKSNATVNKENQLKDYTAFQFKKQGEVTFISSEKEFISNIDIEIAEDDVSRSQGLMYRQKMKENQGMFFVFLVEEFQSFWMRNTVMPLDIIYVNKQNEIVKIHRNAEPYDESSYPSLAPAIYVIEVNAGYTDVYNIKEGDKIVWRRL
jgi:hypothetical protein